VIAHSDVARVDPTAFDAVMSALDRPDEFARAAGIAEAADADQAVRSARYRSVNLAPGLPEGLSTAMKQPAATGSLTMRNASERTRNAS